MKFVGAHQPHRADSNYWNDSFGGHTIVNKNHIDSKSNKTSSSSSNPKISGNQNNYPYQESASSFRIDPETNHRKTLIGGTETVRLCDNDEGEKDEMHREIVCASPGSKRSVLGCCKVSDVIRSVAAVIDSNMMRAQQSFSLQSSSKLISFLHDRQQFRFSSRCFFVVLLILLCTFTNHVSCDENENGSSLGPEFTTLSLVTVPTTPPFDNATRGNKKFGDRCEDTMECGFPGSVCDPRKKSCQCIEDLPVTNHLDKCGKEAAINESCFFNEQCEAFHFQTKCVDNRCVCRFDMSPVVNKDGNVECKGKQMKHDEVERYVDPAMIGVLVGMALMFIIICVVLRLFSRARWRENRTIFNTPNPRLMNVSLLRDNKLMHGQERRGSRMSVRAPSRQPSMASLRPHSPNPSLGKAGSRPGSLGSSNASAISGRSALAASINTDPKPTANCADSNQTSVITNIIENPAAESVSVEILQPKSNRNQ